MFGIHPKNPKNKGKAPSKWTALLAEDEAGVYRRGRNMGHGNIPKSASMAQYRRATGMEVLFGYLSLQGREDRIRELFRIGYCLDTAPTDNT